MCENGEQPVTISRGRRRGALNLSSARSSQAEGKRDRTLEFVWQARPALPRSWADLPSSLAKTRMNHSACSTVRANSHCRAPLRLPLPPAPRIFNTAVSVAAGQLQPAGRADRDLRAHLRVVLLHAHPDVRLRVGCGQGRGAAHARQRRAAGAGPVNARSEYNRVLEYLSRYGIR